MNPINPVGNPQWKDLPSDVIKKVASEVNGLTLCHLSQLSKSTRDITAQEFRVREMRSAINAMAKENQILQYLTTSPDFKQAINPPINDPVQPFLVAARRGNCRSALWLLDHGCSAVSSAKGEGSVLGHLGRSICRIPGYLEGEYGQIFRRMVERGADINAVDHFGAPLIFDALHEMNQPALDFFWQLGADAGALDSEGNTLLHVAVKSHRVNREFLFDLIKRRPESFFHQNNAGNTPLHEAIGSGKVGHARFLLRLGAPVDVVNRADQTPLLKALCLRIPIENLKALITSDTVNHDDIQGNTPLHAACFTADHAAVKLLLEEGAGLNSQNEKGQTPLHLLITYAAPQFSASAKEILDVLLKKPTFDLDVQDGKGRTPLHLSRLIQNRWLHERLLKRGADPFIRDDAGELGRWPYPSIFEKVRWSSVL